MSKGSRVLGVVAIVCLVLCARAGTADDTSQERNWDSSKWQHCVAVTVDNTAGKSPLSHYQVKVVLDSDNFDFAKAQPDGRDLRFVDTDAKTLLAHWIQRFDAAGEEAVVWVRVPNVPASATKTIQMHFGDGTADSASDGASTFEFFDDCESGDATDKWEVVVGGPGFEYARHVDHFGVPGGIWHASGCTRRVSPTANTVYGGAHATYCAWTRPMAVYAPSQNKTFFAFGNAENSPSICSYDHTSHTLADAVVVGTNPDKDAHKNPHILIDDDGYIYVFYRSHCSPAHLAKSARPYDISQWTPMGVVAESSSYPQPWQLKKGEIIVLYRAGGTHNATESCVRSRDGGKTWSEPQIIASSPPKNGFYTASIAEAGEYPRKVHMAWSVTRGDWWQRYHVFYAYSDDGGYTWKKSDGSPHELPITEPTSERIFESDVPDRGVWLKDIQLDSKGNPYILFVDGNTLTYDCVWRVAVCSNGKWGIHEIATCDHMYDAGSLVFLADDDLRAYLPTTPAQPYEDGGDVDEWQSTDSGKSWAKTKAVTSGSEYSHNHVKTVFNHQKGDFRVFWCYGDARVPPETRDVDLLWYGEALPGPKKMDLSYSPAQMPGKLLAVTQPERIESAIRVKGLNLENVAIDARARAGLPSRKHCMLCLRVGDGPCLYGAGLPYGRAKLYEYRGGWTDLLEGERLAALRPWQEWSFRAFGDRLQLALEGEVLADTTDADVAAGGVGVRVWSTSFYLDDIRVRRLSLPEPSATLLRQEP